MEGRDLPQLYDMSADVSESHSVAERHPDVLAQMEAMINAARAQFGPMKRGTPAFGAPGYPLPQAGSTDRQD